MAFLLYGYASLLFGQEVNENLPRCISTEANEAYFDKHPEARKEHQNFNKYSQTVEKRNKGFAQKSMVTVTIPVVVHVFGKTQWGKTVTYEKVRNAIDIVNEDFNGLNADYNTVDPAFSAIKSKMNIKFALAKIDPNGGSTSGVVFHQEEKGFGNDSGYDSEIAYYAWDNYKYMNLYIMADLKDDGVSTRSGVGWFPNTFMSDENIARIVYNGQYLHDNYFNKEFAQLTHEFGHWLNLYHTFNGGCDDPNGDFVSDTPKEDSNAGDKGCTVGASECGNLINYENYMGYDAATGCSKMFTEGQVARMIAALDHPTRKPLWQQENLIATGVNLTGASLITENRIVQEADDNNGTLANSSYDVTILDGTFAVSSGTLTQGTHFTANLPQGYSAVITVENNKKLTVKFTGQTPNHAIANNTVGTITFTNAAITGGISSLNTNKVTYNFSFFDPYKIIYVDIPDETATSSAVWKPFTVNAGTIENRYGAFYENADLKLETYKKALVCQANTKNPTVIEADQLISDDSNWVNGGDYPDLHEVRSSTYTPWIGKTAFVGFQLEMYPGKINYGWLRIRVNASGSEITVLDYAYSTKPNGPIQAGSKELNPDTPKCDDGIQNGDETGIDCGGSCEPCNVPIVYCDSNGRSVAGEYISRVQFKTIDNSSAGSSQGYGDYTSVSTTASKGVVNTITVTPTWTGRVYNEAYSVWIDYNQDGDFEDSEEQVWSKAASNESPVRGDFTIPSNAKNGSTRMRVSMKYNGIPSSCESFSYGEVEDYTIDITGDSGSTCNDGIQNGDETGVDCGGSCSPCTDNGTVVYVDMEDATANTSNTWNFFRIEVGDDNGFGAWFSNNSVRLVTYDKNIVCEGITNNVTLIGEGVQVGPSSNFIANSNSYVVSSSSYTDWNGKSGYIGFAFKINGNTHYGWFYATVANDGLSYTILDYAYNTTPNQGLLTKRNLGVAGARAENLVKVYPNSFSRMTNVDVTKLESEGFTISVYDMLGRIIYQKEYRQNPGIFQLGETITNKGNYFMKITSKITTEVHVIVKE
ncbi:M43 family zinc metalloprotease [Aquimarina mytili]|uniref:Zinc-dependent metalloprotease n=1 Tax=Aquimarina mytili TaxID=874423 RepID=A0A936ZUF7_9FLAO|nr:M43 family zinc metalloprotease [Aquimarina mytili]MBL0682118.1 zinc-dependent metalloprotease [Aquimarina mytili]